MNTIIIVIGALIALLAQGIIMSSYNKYKRVNIKNNLTGEEVASLILKENGLDKVYVTEVKGELTDHYDPTRKVVRLSTHNYREKSIAAASVAAHEVGHALQDKDGYTFLRIRKAIFPIVNISSKLGYFAILIGILFSLTNMIKIGIFLELFILLFQVVTLPVEFDASKRAVVELQRLNLVDVDEVASVKSMLTAAALTYVAGVVNTLLEMLRLVLMTRDND